MRISFDIFSGAPSVALLSLVVWGATVVSAGPITSSLSSYGLVQFSSTSNGGYPPLEVVCAVNPAGCSGTAAVYGTSGLNMAYDAYGLAAYGILGGYASESVSGSIQSGAIPAGLYSVLNGESAFDDTYIVSGGQTGTSGTMTATFTLSGSSISSLGFAGVVIFAIEGSAYSHDCGQLTGPGTITCTGIPITYDQAVNILFQMSTVINGSGWTAGSSATANYAHTAVLTGIAVYDNANSPISNFSIVSSSGAQYTSSGVVPEPSAGCLSAVGLGILFVCAKRLRNQQGHT
jgi:hypothetical protein